LVCRSIAALVHANWFNTSFSGQDTSEKKAKRTIQDKNHQIVEQVHYLLPRFVGDFVERIRHIIVKCLTLSDNLLTYRVNLDKKAKQF
jgi:hypothetical protein